MFADALRSKPQLRESRYVACSLLALPRPRLDGSVTVTACFVINLAEAVDRMNFMAAQMDGLGLDFTRIEAVTPDMAMQAGSEAYWHSWERPMNGGERACLLSHMSVWRKVADGCRPALVLEDDALLSSHVAEVVKGAQDLEGIDHLTLEVRGQRKLVAPDAEVTVAGHKVLRLYQERSGAAAYLLWPSGARKLLQNASRRAGLADAVISRSYELASYQLEPAGAVQLDRARVYGITPPIEARSTIGVARNADGERKGLGFRWRRARAQVRMGLRRCRHPGAKRRRISLVREDFMAGED